MYKAAIILGLAALGFGLLLLYINQPESFMPGGEIVAAR